MHQVGVCIETAVPDAIISSIELDSQHNTDMSHCCCFGAMPFACTAANSNTEGVVFNEPNVFANENMYQA